MSRLKLRSIVPSGLELTKSRVVSARRSALLKARGLADPRLHPSEFTKLKNDLNSFDFYIAIGHGTHHPDQPPVQIPDNLFVVFFTPPGYWGNVKDTMEPEFFNTIRDKSLFKKMIRGTLPPGKVPSLVKTKKWKWEHHIYPPGSYSAAHSLEMFDHERDTHPELHALYDDISGVYEIGTTGRMLNGTTQTLASLVQVFRNLPPSPKKYMLFISGCRGDPRIPFQTMSNLFRQYMYAPPTTVNIPLVNQYVPSIRAYEANIRQRLRKLQYRKNLVNANIARGLTLNKLYKKYPDPGVMNYIRLTKLGLVNKNIASGMPLNEISRKYQNETIRKYAAAVKLQRVIRGRAVRKSALSLKKAKMEKNLKENTKRVSAATKIQSVVRGRAVRKTTRIPTLQLNKQKELEKVNKELRNINKFMQNYEEFNLTNIQKKRTALKRYRNYLAR